MARIHRSSGGCPAGRGAIRADDPDRDLQGDSADVARVGRDRVGDHLARPPTDRRGSPPGRGDLATCVLRGGARELDELANAFNHMAGELADAERAVKTYQAHLEHRVEERTLQLRHLAEHDPLTNLPNRRQLFQRLNDMLDATGTEGPVASHIAVLVDLDNFKTVNDTLGHEFGDRVLTEIGERLRDIAGESGFIARLGGDEFTLVFAYSGDSTEVERHAEHLVASFQGDC